MGGSIGTALLNTIASTAAASYASAHLTESPALLPAHAAVHSYTMAFWWAAGVFTLAAVLTAAFLRSGVAQTHEANESVPAL